MDPLDEPNPRSPYSKYLRAVAVLGIQETDRGKGLAHFSSFCEGTQHDHLGSTWDGAPRDPGVGYLRERLRPQGFVPVNSIPMGGRRPDSSVPLARQIVSRFTEMLLGVGRTPAICVDTDEDTQAYLAALAESSTWWEALSQARDIAGACGCAAIALGLVDGQPTHEVLRPHDLWVAEWDNLATGWRPQVVVQQRLVDVEVQDPKTGRLTCKRVWRTRGWTTTDILTWDDVDERDAREYGEQGKPFPPPVAVPHGAGVCPVVWLQNTLDTERPEGLPDCDGVWHLLDQVDRLQSAATRATHANVNPLLVIRDDSAFRDRGRQLRKGPNGVIRVTAQGAANYLEMQGSGVQSAQAQVAEIVAQILQTTECVVIRPELAKAYQSGEALQILWRSMESRANRLRVQVEAAIRDWARVWLAWGRALGVGSVEDAGEGRGGKILLPPRDTTVAEVEPPEAPEPPEAVEPPEPSWGPHAPGTGVYVRLEWPPYWAPTPAQIKEIVMALNMAAGGNLVSGETATRVASQYLGQDPETEVAAVAREKAEREAKAAAIFAAGGGPGGFGDQEDDTAGGQEPPEDEGD